MHTVHINIHIWKLGPFMGVSVREPVWVRMCTSPHVQGCQGSQARERAVGNGGDGVAGEVSGQA